MAINLLNPIISPTGSLIADTGLLFGPVSQATGYLPIANKQVKLSPGALPTSLTQVLLTGAVYPVTVSAAFEINSVSGGFLLPRMTLTQRNNLIPCNGMQVYNTTSQSLDTYINGAWVEFASGSGLGNVVGPAGATLNAIAVYGDTTGELLANSAVTITTQAALHSSQAPVQLGGIGYLQFVSNEAPSIFVDSLSALNFIDNTSQNTISTVFTGGLFSSGSSPGALVELDSHAGVLLLSRLSTSQLAALPSPLPGMIAYNSTSQQYVGYVSGGTNAFIPIGNPGTVTSITVEGPFLFPETITSTGTISLANSTQKTLLGYDHNGTPTNITPGFGLGITDANVLELTEGGGGTVTVVNVVGPYLTPTVITTSGNVALANSVSNTLLGYAADGTPANISAGNGIQISGNQISLSSGGGGGPVTSVTAGNGLTVSPNVGDVHVSITNTGVTAQTYQIPINVAINAQGQITSSTVGGYVGNATNVNESIYFGYNAGGSPPPTNNYGHVAIGPYALGNINLFGDSATDGADCIAIGRNALRSLPGRTGITSLSAVANIAIGTGAMYSLGNNGGLFPADGYENIAMGKQALYWLLYDNFGTPSHGNIAIGGGQCANTFSAGYENTIVGFAAWQAPAATTIRHWVTAVGAGSSGSGAALAGTGTVTVIGANATVSVDNACVLGNQQNVGIGRSDPIYSLDVANVANTCAIRLQQTNLTPNTPNSTDILFYSAAGVPTLALGTNPPSIVASFTAAEPGTYTFADLTIASNGIVTITSNGVDGGVGSNFFIGKTAGNGTLASVDNTAVGYNALHALSNASSSSNTAFGYNVAANMTDGQQNVFMGKDVAPALTTIVGNTSDNVVIGAITSTLATTLLNTVVIGQGAGVARTSYTNSVYIGQGADATGNYDNAVAIGRNASVSASNSFVLGNGCNVGINQSTPAYTLDLANVSSRCSMRFAVSGGTPATPGNTNDVVLWNNAGVLQTLGTNGSPSNMFANNVGMGTTSTASNAGTLTLDKNSTRVQVITGTTTETIVMPDATTLSVGWIFEINNNSTGLVTVNANGGGLIGTMRAGSFMRVICLSNGSAAGTWDKHWLMPANAIYGTNAMVISGTLNVAGATTLSAGQIVNRTPLLQAATPYTVLTTDYIIAITTLTGAFSVVLPTAAAGNAGQVYYVKDEAGAAAAHNITVTVSGGGNIDGAASNVISTNYGVVGYYSNGTQWYVL